MYTFFDRFYTFLRLHKNQLPLVIILSVAFILRIYKLNTQFGYLGDQGFELLTILHWFQTGVAPLLGPKASVGLFHLGPLYYWIEAPFVFLFHGDPISTVYLNMLLGVGLVYMVYLLLLYFVNKSSALITASLVAISPFNIFMSRGSWNPYPSSFVFVLMLFFFFAFLKSDKKRYLFGAFVALGTGIQLHYTFASNIIALLVLLLFFKPKTFLNPKLILCSLVGFFVPLFPYIWGQIQTNFYDFHYLQLYMQTPHPVYVSISQGITDRIYYIFSNYFPTADWAWYMRFFIVPLYYIVLVGTLGIAFSSSGEGMWARVLLIVLSVNILLDTKMDLHYFTHYYSSFSIVVLCMVGLLISFLYKRYKLTYLWVLGILVYFPWLILNIHGFYHVARTPQVVYKLSDAIISDAMRHKNQSSIGIYVDSPVTLKDGFEYRYYIEKSGFITRSDIAYLLRDDYVIIEAQSINERSNKVENLALNGHLRTVTQFPVTDESGVVRAAGVYQIEPNATDSAALLINSNRMDF